MHNRGVGMAFAGDIFETLDNLAPLISRRIRPTLVTAKHTPGARTTRLIGALAVAPRGVSLREKHSGDRAAREEWTGQAGA